MRSLLTVFAFLAAFVSAVGGGNVAAQRVGRQIIHIAVAAGRQNHGMGSVAMNFTADQVAGDNTDHASVFDHEVEHFSAGQHTHPTRADLPV